MKQILFPPGQAPGTRKLVTIRARVFPEQSDFLSSLDNPSGWLRDAIEAKRKAELSTTGARPDNAQREKE